jgi:LEA14-like dessication related protein
MKRIMVIVFLFLISTSLANAEMKIKDKPQVLDDAVKFGVIQSLTTCAQGHMFLIAYGKAPITTGGESYGMAINTVQIYEERNGKTVPMRCK